jgi:hypothetical protein
MNFVRVYIITSRVIVVEGMPLSIKRIKHVSCFFHVLWLIVAIHSCSIEHQVDVHVC